MAIAAVVLIALGVAGACASPRNTPICEGNGAGCGATDAAGMDLPHTVASPDAPDQTADTQDLQALPPVPPDASVVADVASDAGACPSGTRRCGQACQPEGPAACGVGCVACSTPPNTKASCEAGRCVARCADGYAACGTDKADVTGCLTNVQASSTNCGSCGHSCDGQACRAGLCAATMIASALPKPAPRGAFDGQEFFYFNEAVTQIVAVSKAGAVRTIDVAPGAWYTTLTVAGDRLLWVSGSPSQQVNRMLKSGQDLHQPITTLLYTPFKLAEAGGYLYWASASAGIERSPLAAARVEAVIDIGDRQWTVDDSGFYWKEGDRKIWRRPIAPGGDVVFVEMGGMKTLLTTDATHVYWTEYDEALRPVVMRFRKDRIGSPEVLATDPGFSALRTVGFIAGENVIANTGDDVYVVPRAGGTHRKRISWKDNSLGMSGRWFAIGGDATHLFMLSDDGTFWRVPH